jgi:hypothetical protein
VDRLWAVLVVAVALAAVVGALLWLAARVRRRGIGANVMAAVDEVWRPTAHQSYYEIRAQSERGVATRSPDDHDPDRQTRRWPGDRGPDRGTFAHERRP